MTVEIKQHSYNVDPEDLANKLGLKGKVMTVQQKNTYDDTGNKVLSRFFTLITEEKTDVSK